ncbi:MAG: small basic family protein [Clostridiales bacterium]|jgi:small basic protein|nr:small basic family protein [Clostridiales bacterium]
MIQVIALLIGIAAGIWLPYNISSANSPYVAVAILAGLDSIFGGFVASMNHRFKLKIFVTGLFCNAVLAAGLAYIGKLIGVDLFLAAIVAFGTRLFQNFAILRRMGLEKLEEFVAKTRKKEDVETT